MAFEISPGRYNEDDVNFRHRCQKERLLPCLNTELYSSNFVGEGKNFDDTRDIRYKNTLFDIQSAGNFRENSWSSDVLDDDLSLVNGSPGMYDNASWLKFDTRMEDRREPHDDMFSRYETMMPYRRNRELEDIIMKEKILRSRSNLKNLESMGKICSRLYCPGGAILVMPNGDIHVVPPSGVVPSIDVSVPRGYSSPISTQRQSVMDQTLKRQWCSWRNSAALNSKPDSRSRTNSTVHNHNMEKQLFWRSTINCPIPNHPKDDELNPLLEETLIKVRNVHPTACLHELHVQRRGLFPKKPTFTATTKFANSRRKRNFAVVCNFEFNGARLYTHHIEQTKNDAKMNAARNMLRKLISIRNLTIQLENVTNSGALASFHHPRCQLLHLHDTNPERYPMSPSFQASLWPTLPRSRNNTRCINLTCYFQVGREKLATVGAAKSKKQAVVQAARNMLKRLFPYDDNVIGSQAGSEQALADRMKSPWTCHFCKTFMTGRRPFLSHLTGRSHIERMSELDLSAEEENKILQAAAEEAWNKKEEAKRNTTLKSCTQKLGAQLQSKNGGFFRHNVMNASSQDSQESDGTCKNASASSSEKSEFEVSYSHSSSADMNAIE